MINNVTMIKEEVVASDVAVHALRGHAILFAAFLVVIASPPGISEITENSFFLASEVVSVA